MPSGAEIAGAVGQSAAALPVLIGGGKNKRTATGFYNQPGYDPNASRFGGYAGGLRDYREDLARERAAVDSRGAFTADYGQANWDRMQAGQARNGQQIIADAMGRRALGLVPSIAQMQADRQMQQAVSAQNALAASARGRAGLANANRIRAANVANLQSGISNQAQINAAQERERAEGNAFGAYSGMRQGDQSSESLAAQRAQFQAEQEARNREANDRRAMGNRQLEGQAMGAELNARTQEQGYLANTYASAEQANQNTANQNARAKGIVETFGDIFSDERAKIMLAPGGGRMLSDFTSKATFGSNGGGGWGSGGGHGSISGQGFDPLSGPAAASIEKFKMGNDGRSGLDVDASLKAHSDLATRYIEPTGNMQGGNLMSYLTSAASSLGSAPIGGVSETMLSDAAAKRAAFVEGANYAEENRNVRPERGEQQSPLPKYMQGAKSGEERQMIWHRDQLPQAQRMRREDRNSVPSEPRSMKSFQRDEPVSPDVSPVDRDQAAAIARHRALFAAPPPRPVPQQPAVVPSQLKSDIAQTEQIVSDFTAKMPTPAPPGQKLMLSRGGSNGAPTTGDPLAPRMQFSPSRGWFDPVGDAAAADRQASEDAFDDDLRSTTEEDIRRSETSRLAAEGNAMDPNAQWERSFGDVEAEKTRASFDARNQPMSTLDSNQLEAAKTRARFADGPEEASLSDVYGSALGKFSNAWEQQQRRIASDYTMKEALRADVDRAELGEIQRMRNPTSFRRDTPEDQARVKKAFFDRAGQDADAMLAGYKRSLSEGASVGPVDELDDSPLANAARSMEGQPYVYKREFTPPDQKPGEVNYGFMTQNLRRSPIAATAVKTNPATGLDEVDAKKIIKVMASTIANLQRQEDQTRLMLAKGGRKRAA